MRRALWGLLAAVAPLALAMPGLADTEPTSEVISNQLSDIVTGQVEPPDTFDYPEFVNIRQRKIFNEYYYELWEAQQYSVPAIYTVDLANPFSTSLSDQQDYYRVTGTIKE